MLWHTYQWPKNFTNPSFIYEQLGDQLPPIEAAKGKREEADVDLQAEAIARDFNGRVAKLKWGDDYWEKLRDAGEARLIQLSEKGVIPGDLTLAPTPLKGYTGIYGLLYKTVFKGVNDLPDRRDLTRLACANLAAVNDIDQIDPGLVAQCSANGYFEVKNGDETVMDGWLFPNPEEQSAENEDGIAISRLADLTAEERAVFDRAFQQKHGIKANDRDPRVQEYLSQAADALGERSNKRDYLNQSSTWGKIMQISSPAIATDQEESEADQPLWETELTTGEKRAMEEAYAQINGGVRLNYRREEDRNIATEITAAFQEAMAEGNPNRFNADISRRATAEWTALIKQALHNEAHEGPDIEQIFTSANLTSVEKNFLNKAFQNQFPSQFIDDHLEAILLIANDMIETMNISRNNLDQRFFDLAVKNYKEEK